MRDTLALRVGVPAAGPPGEHGRQTDTRAATPKRHSSRRRQRALAADSLANLLTRAAAHAPAGPVRNWLQAMCSADEVSSDDSARVCPNRKSRRASAGEAAETPTKGGSMT
jgi:hypothetical protein